MNRWIALLSLATIALAATAWWEHQIIAAQSAQIAEFRSHADAREKLSADQLKASHDRDEALKSEAEQLRAKLAANPAPAEAGSSATPAPTPDKTSPLLKMLKDPNMRKMIAAQQRMAMPMLYGDLVKKLGLSPEDANKLYDLLAEMQVKTINAGMDQMDGKKTAATKPDDNALKEFLGDRYPQYQQYTKTVAERFALDQFTRTLTGANSLQDTQQEGLLQIMGEERARAPSNVLYSSNSAPMEQKVAALNSPDAMAEFEAQQNQINQSVLARAKSILSPTQIEALAAYQEQQLQTMKAQLEMSKKMLTPSGTTP